MLTIDSQAFAWIVTHRVAALDGGMLALSVVGRGGMVWLAVGIVLAVFRRVSPLALAQLALAILLATLAADHVLKPIVSRHRPFVTMPDVAVIGERPSDSSFPSGHAANAFAGALIVSRALPALAIAWWMLAGTIAFSRVYLGVHYPIDVIGGAIVGLACAAVARCARLGEPRRSSRKS